MKDFFTFDEIMRDLVIVLAIWLLIYITKYIAPVTPTAIVSGETYGGFMEFFQGKVDFTGASHAIFSLYNVLGFLAMVFLAAVFWITLRTAEIHKADSKKYKFIKPEVSEGKAMTIQWQIILDHVNSESLAEWKLAILEADSMLDEILDAEGYIGESLGEKLKTMSSRTISSYDDLWEAHKMRNQIAHEGTGVELTKKMARDTITKFENAFKEMGYI